MGVVCPIKEAFVGGRRHHSQILGKDEGQEFIPLVACIFGALDAANCLHNQTGIRIRHFTERMARKS